MLYLYERFSSLEGYSVDVVIIIARCGAPFNPLRMPRCLASSPFVLSIKIHFSLGFSWRTEPKFQHQGCENAS
jgi:hypothetical protein